MDELLERVRSALADRYEVEQEIGVGGGAHVFAARDRKHERQVAIKVLRPELALALGAERFLREIRLVASLAHPHVLPLHDSGEADGLLYYVMPRVEGETLRDRLRRERQLPVHQAVTIARQIAGALEFAHRHGVLHRDVKPENIFLAGDNALIGDFGIARSTRIDDHLSAPGVASGTPAYMSPEQASGEEQLGPASDIYSLACVLYEMLVGQPPFIAATPQATIARRFAETAPRVRLSRPRVSEELDEAVAQGLSLVPADRFSSMQEFCEAIPTDTATGKSGTQRVVATRRRERRRLWTTGALGAVAVASLAALAVVIGRRRDPVESAAATAAVPLDSSLHVVLPFAHRNGAGPHLMTGDQCELLIYDAFTRWRDVRLVNDLRVNDARARRPNSSAELTLTEALDIARSLGAGTLVWGDVGDVGDSLLVRAAVYEVARGGGAEPARSHSIRIAKSLTDVGVKFLSLADSLLVGKVRAVAAAGGAMGTRSLGAWRAYERGHLALARWDLPAAIREFRQATAVDQEYALGQMWLARTLMWAGAGSSEAEWTAAAREAHARRAALGDHDRLAAEALLALAERRYPESCQLYRGLVARDSLDFIAWYGLGECHRRDALVVRSTSSPSGYAFRASYHAAIEAYQRALLLLPSVHGAFRGAAFDRLPRLLYAESNRIRRGWFRTARGDSLSLGAFPALVGDTLAFIPYPQADVAAGKPGVRPTTLSRAVTRNREVLRDVTATWVRSFPDRASAYEQHAFVLETLGRLEGTNPLVSAVAAIVRARALEGESSVQYRLAVADTRLRLKTGRLVAARALADSLLQSSGAEAIGVARTHATLAVLTGRPGVAASWLQRDPGVDSVLTNEGQLFVVPHAIGRAAATLLAYASAGGPADTLAAVTSRLEQLLAGSLGTGDRGPVREVLLWLPASIAYPAVPYRHAGWVPRNRWLRVHEAHRTGALAEARLLLDSLATTYRAAAPDENWIDGAYRLGVLYLAVGDTTSATGILESSLQRLPALPTALLDEPHLAGCLVRAMGLRAEIAARRGDAESARRWGRAVTTLWSGAEPALGEYVSRMQSFAGN